MAENKSDFVSSARVMTKLIADTISDSVLGKKPIKRERLDAEFFCDPTDEDTRQEEIAIVLAELALQAGKKPEEPLEPDVKRGEETKDAKQFAVTHNPLHGVESDFKSPETGPLEESDQVPQSVVCGVM